jgi:hypothetical protein
MKPTAPLARAGGGETRFAACLLAKGLSPQSARRLMLIVRRNKTDQETFMAKWEYVHLYGGKYGAGIAFHKGLFEYWIEFIRQVYNVRDEHLEVGEGYINIQGADLMVLLTALGRHEWEIAGVSKHEQVTSLFLKRLIPEEEADQ